MAVAIGLAKRNEMENGDPVCVCNNDGHHLESVCMEPIPLFQKAETSNRFGHFFLPGYSFDDTVTCLCASGGRRKAAAS
jgi:hypothetical protein